MVSIKRKEGESFEDYKIRRKKIAEKEKSNLGGPIRYVCEQLPGVSVIFRHKPIPQPTGIKKTTPAIGKRHKGESLVDFARRRRKANARKKKKRKGGNKK